MKTFAIKASIIFFGIFILSKICSVTIVHETNEKHIPILKHETAQYGGMHLRVDHNAMRMDHTGHINNNRGY